MAKRKSDAEDEAEKRVKHDEDDEDEEKEKEAEEEEEKEDNAADEDEDDGDGIADGSWNGKEWTTMVKDEMKLTVSKFKGKIYVDIRHTYDGGKPTKKGAHIPLDDFKKLMKWKGLDKALAKLG
uniref:Transcriptional coactivator p15 (PC4) C-terminal domain-containing protein n=1 Tax=Chromera velia CCMP2878 TaxID=1169474 RepID=A0A0G4F2T2_9ALVE|mmetsp:Transcript_45811/g.90235  ORF Transcript_45811/g.90235 Transcript_45811/m.90235 type:complete len:124 (+) Transcript_45811:184-555(+)|eukprot:Cvel_14767.t1-p1 / transcript=Cvel_14767.t1 / gene=Cvel_14767 / organism=Chromera_velia_CCMP2878 / gene_product=hypothetical protein / transcript_product=hypothetical protein / location=Cvel_scaffold1063:29473-31098(-) / protein_length=123 / sequence_SO=supercontig / SO=protein_coding / is_pseudo=false